MPHECTNCARVFDDGSKEMLSGCPDCGGNKFQFRPDGTDAGSGSPANDPDTEEGASEPVAAPEPSEAPTASTVARTVGKTAATVRDLVGGSDDTAPTIGADGSDPVGPVVDDESSAREDTAQASARTDLVTPDELPSAANTETEHRFQPVRDDATAEGDATPHGTEAQSRESAAVGRPADAEDDPEQVEDRPDLEELRAELNDQFESIKVLSPGQYELNLMELYDREEYIVALQEDGRYSIQVPENFRT